MIVNWSLHWWSWQWGDIKSFLTPSFSPWLIDCLHDNLSLYGLSCLSKAHWSPLVTESIHLATGCPLLFFLPFFLASEPVPETKVFTSFIQSRLFETDPLYLNWEPTAPLFDDHLFISLVVHGILRSLIHNNLQKHQLSNLAFQNPTFASMEYHKEIMSTDLWLL